MKISVLAEKCTGCRICELACSHAKLESFAPKNACIKVVTLDYWGFSNPVFCVQCKQPNCVKACTAQALHQTESGTILLDETKCTGCGLCMEDCPIGAVNWDEERKLPMICDLCGGKPACVEWCPMTALTLAHEDRKKVTGKGKKELKYSVAKGKRSLNKLNMPDEVFNWYDKFTQA
jgi:carbon-monoxide dehydrogenase iron sulfur subunit